MLIPITFNAPNPGESSLPPALAKVSASQVMLVELQGTLEVESTFEGERDGKLVGILSVDEALKRPTLRIGNHHLEGKIVSLVKPLAVLHKTTSPINTDFASSSYTHKPRSKSTLREETNPIENEKNAAEEPMDEDEEGDENAKADLDEDMDGQARETTWEAVAIVKRKIVFSKRPMPIKGNT
ncbi:hypothetical protein CYLTODRAFT_426951 [Cylindrobasidium torrendii FP15055 ss-10]|uniref:Ctf8-domain-containing protein n=1 Tax=Cylindrobasidium torrendii FP15055 ss-10 TaxID=1314674 RepID=A0A0D7AX23_9AGAR|nr:hypothetical protein CYLTODRAFT_426951 [Cylindrobasidium torrendii FP15055 ss-10]